MAEKTVTSKITLAVACPERSVKDSKGRYTTVEIKHVPAGEPVELSADEADALIERGHAVEVAAEPAPAKGKKAAEA